MENDNTIELNFQVYAEEPGQHIITCSEFPFLLERGHGMQDCIDRITSKVGTLLKQNREIFQNGHSAHRRKLNDAWHFQLIIDLEDCSIIKVNENRNLANH